MQYVFEKRKEKMNKDRKIERKLSFWGRHHVPAHRTPTPLIGDIHTAKKQKIILQ